MNSKPPLDDQQFRTNIVEFMAHLQDSARQLADHLRVHPDESALAKLLEVVDGCQLVVECLIKVGDMHLESADAEAQCHWSGAEKALEAVVRATLAAFEKRDFVLVADLMEDELIQTLNVWDGVIKSSGGVKVQIQSPMGG